LGRVKAEKGREDPPKKPWVHPRHAGLGVTVAAVLGELTRE